MEEEKMNGKSFTVSPVGFVRCGKDGFCLEISKDYRAALKGLEGFSHINVFWWGHLCDDSEHRKVLECEQPYKNSPSRLGIFATRSPLRPNPIALSAVAILKIDHERGIIHIPYIDAEDGTPVIDLKPYHPSVDRIRKASVPEWCSHWPECYEDSAHFDWESEFVNAQ
ncbi:MAG: SAM-dependent methyltransferase [Candidatus Riflebacteria bacterium]|nr:SAM-dependent methyltransferase [Candidatus Riflebacteria bacterium]